MTQIEARDDPGARRNRGEGGLWLVNLLVSALVALLSLYVFRPEQTRHEVRAAAAALVVLPVRLAAPPVMAASPAD